MGKNTKNLWDVLIIGAGAAGLMAAITAAKENRKVCVLEQTDKPGKKLYATGNGRCNFTNADMRTECFGGDSAFVESVLERFTVEDCLEFFHSIGIFPKNKNGYYYPSSEQAASVVTALVQAAWGLGVVIRTEQTVTQLLPEEHKVTVRCGQDSYQARKVIIATGLLAAPKLGSNGSLFGEIKRLGHRFQPILPALCGFYCEGMEWKKVSGVRANGTVSALIDGEVAAEDTGEIQFTDYGLSGIPVFQISRHLSRGLYEKKRTEVRVNLLPEFTAGELQKELDYRKVQFCKQRMDNFFNGLLNQKLGDLLLKRLGIDGKRDVASLLPNELQKMQEILQNIVVTVTKYRDFEFAQVCTGGIPTADVNNETLESKFAEHIYFAGEILDVDGICGGYNLHFAWATGMIAGNAASKQ